MRGLMLTVGLIAIIALLVLMSMPSVRDFVFVSAAITQTELARKLDRDPVRKAIDKAPARAWGTPVQLTPTPFEVGQRVSVVEETLLQLEYQPWDAVGGWQPTYLKEENADLAFSRYVEGLPCNVLYFVFLDQESNGAVRSVKGAVHEAGCL